MVSSLGLPPSGLVRRTTFDLNSQNTVVKDENGSGTVIAISTFTYDAVGNRKSIFNQAGRRTTYTYDAKNRLTADDTTGTDAHSYAYSYDANDNRRTSNETGTLATFNYDAANRLTTSIEGSTVTSYTYDANGNLTVSQTGATRVTMAYDKENRLTRHDQAGSIATYLYEGDGMKQVELVDGTRTTLVWDGSDYLQARS